MDMTTIAGKLQLKVGGDAYISDAFSRLKIGTVKKITPGGQVVVGVSYSNENLSTIYRFGPNGREMGAPSQWRYANLISEEDYDRSVKVRKRENQSATYVKEIKAFVELNVNSAELPGKLEDFAKRLRAWQLES